MDQVSPSVDKRLHRLSRTIGKADAALEKANKAKNAAWDTFVETADKSGNPQLRFLADDGHHMTLQWRQAAPKRDDALLEQKIRALCETEDYRRDYCRYAGEEEIPSAEVAFERIWNLITVRVVDSTLLEATVMQQRIPVAVVTEAVTQAAPTFARIRQPWTADDKTRAEIFGVRVVE